jgi:hypothetical protein
MKKIDDEPLLTKLFRLLFAVFPSLASSASDALEIPAKDRMISKLKNMARQHLQEYWKESNYRVYEDAKRLDSFSDENLFSSDRLRYF